MKASSLIGTPVIVLSLVLCPWIASGYDDEQQTGRSTSQPTEMKMHKKTIEDIQRSVRRSEIQSQKKAAPPTVLNFQASASRLTPKQQRRLERESLEILSEQDQSASMGF